MIMIKAIKPNIGLWLSLEPLAENLQNAGFAFAQRCLTF